MDYKEIGFKAGLEIHQQLQTHKLFCLCPSKITDETANCVERMLRPTRSELGDIDTAALEEAERNRRFFYITSDTSTCLVEADEEPPHVANNEAIDICLTMALLLGAQPVDEIQFMRKIVIDGSNTTGFQRTALVAMGGHLDNVRICTLAIEEDAARKIKQKENNVYYGLDRLGIPLIEITTEADLTSPRHAQYIAEQLGVLLQGTKKVKKGLGTIRQDLNISITKGSRVEIKGIQSLHSISKVAENEALRQNEIIEIAETLNERTTKNDILQIQNKDLSMMLHHTKSKLIQDNLHNKGCIKGIRLPGYQGLLKKNHTWLGKDFALYAGIISGISGIIHSDEMSGYGLIEEEINEIKQKLQIDDNDAFVLAFGEETRVNAALRAVLRRALMFFDGVPEEVRRSLPDNTTEYMRPLPGAARMYPETDVPPVRIRKERLQNIHLPEKPTEKRQRFSQQYNLNEEQISQLLSSGYEEDFENHIARYPTLGNVILRIYLNIIPELENQNLSQTILDEKILPEILSGLHQGLYAKEAVPVLLKYLILHPNECLKDAIKNCYLTTVNEDDIKQVIKKILFERRDFIKKRGKEALGPLMGLVMNELRGKADGKLISTILQEELAKIIPS
jgi:glutamyl-tRNA(Gln) amidotransferase subunit E